MRMSKGKPFKHIKAEAPGEPPVFSEVFLYDTVGKDDARFILGVADEYEHVIDALGPKAVKAILGVKPRLVQRLGTGEKVADWLEDARDERDLRHEDELPSQVILDEEGAEAVWNILHEEYSRTFEPEAHMDSAALALYHKLTDGLGQWNKQQRQKEIDRLPQKLERKAKHRAEVDAKRARLRKRREAREAVVAALGNVDTTEAEEALALYEEAWSS